MSEDKDLNRLLPAIYEKMIVDQIKGWEGVNKWMGLPEPTEEQKERYHQRCLKAAETMTEYIGLDDRIAQLHTPHGWREGWLFAQCQGCDFGGFEGEMPDWPCRTALIVMEQHDLNTEAWT